MRSHAPITATAALLLLALTGCTSTPATTAGESTAAKASEPSADPTVAPITAPPVDTPTGSPDDVYLDDVRRALDAGQQGAIAKASDEQLVRAGHDACAASASGTPDSRVTVIEDEKLDPQWDSYAASELILKAARRAGFC